MKIFKDSFKPVENSRRYKNKNKKKKIKIKEKKSETIR